IRLQLMASADIDRLSALLRQRPNTQPLHTRASQATSREDSRDTSPNFSRSASIETVEGTGERDPSRSDVNIDRQSNHTSGEPAEDTTSAIHSRCSSPSVGEFPFAPSQYVSPNLLKRKFSEDLTNFAKEQIRLHALQGLDAEDVVKHFAHVRLFLLENYY